MFVGQLQSKGFVLSPKSTITSTKTLAKKLVKFFKRLGVTLKTAQVGMHLGIAKVSKPRFAFTGLSERFAKAAKRVSRILRPSKRDSRAKTLFKTGALPQAACRAELIGLSPHLAHQLDKMAAHSFGKSSSLLDLNMALMWSCSDVPSVETSLKMVMSWVQFWHDSSEKFQEEIRPAWNSWYAKLVG